MSPNETIEKLLRVQHILIDYATGNQAVDAEANAQEYISLRAELMGDAQIRTNLPRLLVNNRDLFQFWSFIKMKFAHYQERREFIWSEFNPLIEKFETQSNSPADDSVSNLMAHFDADHVHEIWRRALERRETDPEGAITASRTLLESVCKHILDEQNIPHPEGLDLPKLYKLTAEQLNLAPSQHSEQIFKQISGGCQTVVEGLGAVRNKLGDAHGKGKASATSAARHAELSVNLAGAMATFLVRTWENQ